MVISVLKDSIKRVYLSFLIVAIIGITQNVYAQQSDDSLKVEMEPIEVTAIHTTISSADAPLALSTISRDLNTLNHESALSLQSISENMPGLWVNDRQNYALGERLTIRGVGWRAAFGVRGIQVVLNGIPLTVADGQTMINVVDPAFIRRAELVRGPAATYWGNSSGGVLYLSTKAGYGEQKNFRIRTMGGSYGMKKAEAEFSFSNSKHQMSGYGSYLNTHGFRDYSAAKVLRTGVTGTISLTSKSQLQYQAASIYMPNSQHPSSLTEQDARENPTEAIPFFVDAKAGKQITQGQAGLSYTLNTPAGIFDVTGYGIYRDLNNPLPFGIITINRWVGGLRSTLEKKWNNLSLQAGLEAKLQNDDRTEFENEGNASRGAINVDQVEEVWNQAIFATATYSFNKFNVLGGVRLDRITFSTDAKGPDISGERSFTSLSPSIGINYKPSSQTLFANLSTSFDAPTTTELVNRPGGGNGFNPDLNPEHTLGLEAGIRGSNKSGSLRYDVTAYRLWIRDLLFPYQLESNGPTFYQNQGETIHTGVETYLSWEFFSTFSLSATANITDAKFQNGQTVDSLALSGKSVPGIPRLRMNGQIGWSPGDFITSLSYQFVGDYSVNNLNTADNERYSVWDARISYKKIYNNPFVRVQPFINLNNIFDTRYNGSTVVNAFGGRYYEPAPGRNFQMGISVIF